MRDRIDEKDFSRISCFRRTHNFGGNKSSFECLSKDRIRTGLKVGTHQIKQIVFSDRYLNAFEALKQPLQVCSVLYCSNYFAQSMRYKTELNQLR